MADHVSDWVLARQYVLMKTYVCADIYYFLAFITVSTAMSVHTFGFMICVPYQSLVLNSKALGSSLALSIHRAFFR